MTCCIVLTAEGHPLTDDERTTLVQYRAVFRARPFVLFAPSGCPWAAEYAEILKPVRTVQIPVIHAVDPVWLSQYRLSPEFYDSLSDYDYALVVSLKGWALYDALDWWMTQGYDYTAAPWLGLSGDASGLATALDLPRGGCSDASLRNVRALYAWVKELRATGFEPADYDIDEGIVLSGGYTKWKTVLSREPRYCPRTEQARFAWYRPGPRSLSVTEGAAVTNVNTLFDITRGCLPMLLHDPQADVRRKLCLPDTAPDHVFLFSSAVRSEYDYVKCVDSVEPDRRKRLLVFMNECRAFRLNDSGYRLACQQGRVVTVSNFWGQPPFGPAHFGELPVFLARKDWPFRRDSYTVMWRRGDHRFDAAMTHDGEVVAARESEILSRLGPELDGAMPTAGYSTCRLMRTLHPAAKVHLVNFYGNSNGFRVADMHDPVREHAILRADPQVDFIYA